MAFSKRLILAIIFTVFAMVKPSEAALDVHYYDGSCPAAEKIILETVRNATLYDPKVSARLLRMFFHDCFIRVCIFFILKLIIDPIRYMKVDEDRFEY